MRRRRWPLERRRETGPQRQPRAPAAGWQIVYPYGIDNPGQTAIHFGYQPLPPWNSGPYKQDVPVVRGY